MPDTISVPDPQQLEQSAQAVDRTRSAVKNLTEDFGSEEYGVGIRKGDAETVEAINNAFEEMKKDGKMAEISQKWFGEDITDN